MELIKKTTILFPPALHEHLVRVARQKGVSLGELVRRACEARYGYRAPEETREAVRQIGRLSLPSGTPSEMKSQSVPSPKEPGA